MDQVIAVDLGATRIRCAAVSENGDILNKLEQDTPRIGDSGMAVTSLIADMVAGLLADSKALGIGISSAGPIDMAAGEVVCSPNLAYTRIPLTAPLNMRFGLPVFLQNDGTCGVIGEHWMGSAQGHEHAVYITISTGLGGGVMVDGRPIFGRGGNAGEIGHFFVDDRYRLPCRCGETGHWEAYAAGSNLPTFFAIFSTANGHPVREEWAADAKGIFEAAERGNQDVLAFMDTLGEINARGVSDVIVAYDPEIIILDGGVARNHSEKIIRALLPYLDEYLSPPLFKRTGLEGNAPLLGAARSAFDTIGLESGQQNQRFLTLPP